MAERFIKSLNGYELRDKTAHSQISALQESIAQADWSVNDETSAAYVKNRPFYGDVVLTEILAETTFDAQDQGGVIGGYAEGTLNITIGTTYTVVFDGVSYECVAIDDGYGTVVIGNLRLYSSELDDTGEPFAIFAPMPGYIFYYARTAGSHTYAIMEHSGIKKLEIKYLPSEVVTKSYVGRVIEENVDSLQTTIDTIKSHIGLDDVEEDTALPADFGDAYAIYDSSTTTLYFVRSETEPSGTFTASDGTNITCTAVYSGIETDTYSSFTPWYSNSSSIKSVRFIDTIKPISTAYWFYYHTVLTTIDLSNLDTSNVTDMSYMFKTCTSLKFQSAICLDTSNVTDMSYMFGSSNSTTLDLSNFDTSNVTDMSYMFDCCVRLTTIYASDLWSTEAVTSSSGMFTNCASLVGDIAYDSNYTDKTYATTSGGYLTYKAYVAMEIASRIIISTSEPTTDDGKDGDIWIVYEA